MADNKIKLLILWDILQKNTDENHAMNSDEVREELAKQGISVIRRVVANDMATLNDYGYDNPRDFISEQMIQSFKLSVNELLVCNEMSVSKLITEHRGYERKLKDFKKNIDAYCHDMGYNT